MSSSSRRDFLRTFAAATGAGLGTTLFPPAIRKALAISPRRCKGTIEDVEHVVISMQESCSLDPSSAPLPACVASGSFTDNSDPAQGTDYVSRCPGARRRPRARSQRSRRDPAPKRALT